VRRQSQNGGINPAGSSCAERLDPFSLPLRFSVSDKAADERVRHVELTRERVVHRRALAGMKMAVNLPVAAYLGIALRMQAPTPETPGTVSIVLEHRDPGLSLPLYLATDGNDIVAEWQSWGRALQLPLLVAEADGRLREPFARIGAVAVATPIGRRRNRSVIKRRRPSVPLRRVVRMQRDAMVLHCDEREIIARN
jgi:hypothetical protein